MLKNIEDEILKRVKTINPNKVIIFGSFADGTFENESDIDLYVVTRDDFIPRNYRENMDHYLKVSNTIRDLKREFPIDLIVHSLAMHKKFINMQSSFSRKILNKGRVLYEADY